MRAIVLEEHGDADRLIARDLARPAADAGMLLIRNTCVGVNFIDIYQRRGLYPVGLPAVLGSEGVGVVEAAGEGAPFAPGARVAYLCGGGAYAEYAHVDACRAAQIPDQVSDETAAAGFLKGLTAEMLVRQVYALRRGDAALIHAAAGGVGTLLVQWARHIGARVIAVVGGAEKERIARENGADEVIDRLTSSDIAAEVRVLTHGRGVDVAYDSIGAETFISSLDSIAMRGMMVSYGNASGPPPAISPLELSRRGSLTLSRPSLFHYATQERLPAMAERVFALFAQGALTPRVAARVPFEEAAHAHRLLESGATIGAIILAL